MFQLIFYAICTASLIYSIYTCIYLRSFLSEQGVLSVDRDVNAYDDLESHWTNVLADIGLIVLFIAQHSWMAMVRHHKLLHSCGLAVVDRALYCVFASLTLQVLMRWWKPYTAIWFWHIQTSDSFIVWVIFAVAHTICWIILLLECLTFDPLEMFGFKQIYNHFRGREHPLLYQPRPLQAIYRNMRHPGAMCFLIILWFHPVMTLDRYVLASLFSLYLFFANTVSELDYDYFENYVTKRVVVRQRFSASERYR